MVLFAVVGCGLFYGQDEIQIDFVNPTSTSSNPLFADGVPEHLQFPPEWIFINPSDIDDSFAEKIGLKLESIAEEVMEKWNPGRPLPEVWPQFIERRKRLKDHSGSPYKSVELHLSVQLMLDFPEVMVLLKEDPRAYYVMEVELGNRSPDWNVAILHDGRSFRMKANHRYEFRFTELVDIENGLWEMKSYELAPLVEPSDLTCETVIIHLDHVTDEAFQRLSDWNYNINPYTTGAYKLGDNKTLEKNRQKPAAETSVSPFGFGRYPEVPDDFPGTPSWLNPNRRKFGDLPRRDELSYRVWIKLWNQGNKQVRNFLLSGMEGRELFYPIYPNTVYVQYDETERVDGSLERRPFIVTYGQVPDESRALLDEGVIPPNVCVVVVSADSNVAIDPYVYLQLE